MDRRLVQSIVESLRVDVPREARLAGFESFGLRDWQRTLSWLDDSGLALYLLERLNQSDSLQLLPLAIQSRLQHNLASNQRRVAEMKEEFRALNGRFDEAGVKYAVLKGFALVPNFCPDAALRLQYDFDYLVHPDSEATAQSILREAGYSRKGRSPGYEPTGETTFGASPLTAPTHEEGFYSAALPRGVELHLDLWQPERDRIDLEVPKDALDRIRRANCEGISFPALAEDDALLFQVLHAFQHVLTFWCRPSCFLEIAYFIARRSSDAGFWEQFRMRVSGYRQLPAIAALVFAMAERLFQAPLPAQVRIWMMSKLPEALTRWVERYGTNWTLAPFPGSKLSLLVHRQFIDDPAAWRTVAWSRLFPLHRPAQVVEPAHSNLTSRWKIKWQQGAFVLRRLQFHLRALWGLGWKLLRWTRVG